MTVDSELNRSEMYKVLNVKCADWDSRYPTLLVAKDIENLEKERLKHIEFFDESRYTPVILEDINTIRKTYNYNFRDIYWLFDFFEDINIDDVGNSSVLEINELCREMHEEIERQEVERTLSELETGRAVVKTNSIGTTSEDFARRLYEQLSSCRPSTVVNGVTVTNENTANVRGTWFVG